MKKIIRWLSIQIDSIKTVIKWLPIIWNDRQWDFDYLTVIWKHKLYLMLKYWSGTDNIYSSDETIERNKETIAQAIVYLHEYEEYDGVQDFISHTSKKKELWHKFSKVVEDNMEKWWD